MYTRMQIVRQVESPSSALVAGAPASPAAAPIALYVPDDAKSRYALIGEFYRQIGTSAVDAGMEWNPAPVGGLRAVRPSIFLFINAARDPQVISEWIGSTAHMHATPIALVQWLIDHPFNLDRRLVDAFCTNSRYCLVTVADDDAMLLRMRWPTLQHFRVSQGVPRDMLVDPARIEPSHMSADSRDIDVLLTGTIASDAEIEQLRSILPASVVLEKACDEIVQLRVKHPSLGFLHAVETCVPSPFICPDHWGLLAAMFRLTTALANRERRIAMLRSLARTGLSVTVLGTASWRGVVEDLRRESPKARIRLVQDVDYAHLPPWIARAKVYIGVNPTQFVHAYSERLLLGLASGAATVTDDRIGVRREFQNEYRSRETDGKPCLVTFDPARPDDLASRVVDLLANPSQRVELALNGRTLVEKRHLWSHRLLELKRKLGAKF